MNKTKVIPGILITIAGGTIMITSMVFAIIHFAGNLYDDIYTFNVDMLLSSTPAITKKISIKEKKELSLWLKLPNRQIENKDLKITVFLIDENNNVVAEFNENFRSGYFRNSSGDGQFYKIGQYSFPSGFNGYLRYETKGKWVPPFKGKFVLRQASVASFPIKQISSFIIGIFFLVVGIGTIAKNCKRQKTNKVGL